MKKAMILCAVLVVLLAISSLLIYFVPWETVFNQGQTDPSVPVTDPPATQPPTESPTQPQLPGVSEGEQWEDEIDLAPEETEPDPTDPPQASDHPTDPGTTPTDPATQPPAEPTETQKPTERVEEDEGIELPIIPG